MGRIDAAGSEMRGVFALGSLEIPSLEGKVGEEEWKVRVDLAAAYRLIAHFGWDDLVFTHLSARVPGPENHFLLNPYQLMFDEVTASSLVKVDMSASRWATRLSSPMPRASQYTRRSTWRAPTARR